MMDGAQGTPARRGSLRLKVKPSKFRSDSPVPAASQDKSHAADPPRTQAPPRLSGNGKDGSKSGKPAEKLPKTQAPPRVSVTGKDGGKSVKSAEKIPKRSAGTSADGQESSMRQALSPDLEHRTSAKDGIVAASASQTNRNSQLRLEQINNELTAALMVVRKIMKMEAAEPFNSPVDPVALGIPDYFDVIKIPMDLGTICQSLERGRKYRNARDVYEDVQLVWTNCRNYNHKGDPILDLMSRVKKNFMKYWTAAGLYTEKTPASVEQVTSESKAREARQISDQIETGLQSLGSSFGEHEESWSILNNDPNAKVSKPVQPKIITVYKAHGNKAKKKLQEQQGNVVGHSLLAGRLLEGIEWETRGQEDPGKKLASVETSQRKKDGDLQGTPNKSRRVSGTGHHKSDCSCVVCTGVRRKLAREAEATTATASVEEESSVKFNSEGNADVARNTIREGSGVKFKSGKRKRENAQSVDIFVGKGVKGDGSTTISREKTNVTVHEEISGEGQNRIRDKGTITIIEEGVNLLQGVIDAGTEAQTSTIAWEAGEEETRKGFTDGEKDKQNRDTVEGVDKVETTKAVAEEGAKGGSTEELDDKEDAIHNDEHFVEDTEADRQEGGIRYYRASYEMPLRKINPSILQMGQRLFGSGSPWKRGNSLGSGGAKGCSENPISAAVSMLLGNKESLMLR